MRKPPTVLLVFENLPASFGAVSLYVRGKQIGSSDETLDWDISGAAENLSDALEVSLAVRALEEEQLARYIADKKGKLDEFNPSGDLKKWVKGYTPEDVLGALGFCAEDGETNI